MTSPTVFFYNGLSLVPVSTSYQVGKLIFQGGGHILFFLTNCVSKRGRIGYTLIQTVF